MPGSPPSSTTAPGTSPPPSTRSSSARPVGIRSTLFAWTPASGTIAERAPETVSKRFAGGVATDSTSVFHVPQCGHWPCHLGDCPPHSVQL